MSGLPGERLDEGGWSLLELAPRSYLDARIVGDDDAGDDVEVVLPTGGSGAALIRRASGLAGLWRAGSRERPTPLDVLLPALLEWDGGPLPPGVRLSPRPGGWERLIPLPGAHLLQEVGFLPRELGVVVVQHRPLAPDGAPPRVRVLGGSDEVTRGEPFLAPLRARQNQREQTDRTLGIRGRGRPRAGAGGTGADARTTAGWWAAASSALEVLDESPLRAPGVAAPWFLGGLETEAGTAQPVWLEDVALAETGLGLLLAGDTEGARSALRRLASDPTGGAAPLGFLLLAARYSLWTGDPGALVSIRPAVERAIHEASRATSPAPAALLPLSALLEELAAGVEPLGPQGWSRELRTLADRIGKGAVASPGGPLVLPVVGRTPLPHSSEGSEGRLPQPEHFGSPLTSTFLPHRTLHAARLVRSVVEGLLGSEAEGALGRLRLAPRIPEGLDELEVDGLRVGDARVTFSYRRDGQLRTFVLRQTEGRVPINLGFEPTFDGDQEPAIFEGEVRMEGERIEVERFRRAGRPGFRLQFPLDPGRTLTHGPAVHGNRG